MDYSQSCSAVPWHAAISKCVMLRVRGFDREENSELGVGLTTKQVTNLNVRGVNRFLMHRDSSGSRLDLRAVKFVTPAAVVELAALCFSLHEAGRQAEIVLGNSAVTSYLLRANFASVLGEVAKFNPGIRPEYLRRLEKHFGSSWFLVELTKLESGGAIAPLLERVLGVLRHELRYKERHAYDITVGISEALQNVFDHNEGALGFFAMQVYGTGTQKRLEVGIGDIGLGFAASLRKHYGTSIATESDAIIFAAQFGVSEFDDPTRGWGLPALLRIVRDLRGTAYVRSGSALSTFSLASPDGNLEDGADLPGSSVSLVLPSNTVLA